MAAEISKQKRCSSCGVEKPLNAFGVDSGAASGLLYHCKVCARIKLAEQRKKFAAQPREAVKNKVCPGCHVDKQASEFGLNSYRGDCLSFYCKSCQRRNDKGYRDRLAITVKEVPKLKTCSSCQVEREISFFQKDRRNKDGFHPYCKLCHSKKEKTPEARKKWADYAVRYRKKMYSVPFSYDWWRMKVNPTRFAGLTAKAAMEQYTADPHCHYCRVLLDTTSKLTIDHVIPQQRGGSNEADNLVFACAECNRLKFTMTKPEFLAFIKVYGARFADPNPIRLYSLSEYAAKEVQA